MQKLFMLIVLILSIGSLQANVNVDDANCWIYLQNPQNDLCLEVSSTGTAPYTYEWSSSNSNGNSACLEDGLDNSFLCVTVTDSDGCIANACQWVGDSTTMNCYVSIEEISTGIYEAVTEGSDEYTYSWSNGESSSSINPYLDSLYCVTVTNVTTGCVAIACDELESCFYADISFQEGDFCLEVNADGTPPYTYLWNTGATTNSICDIQYLEYYTVSVTDANGCIAEVSQYTYYNCQTSIDSTDTNLLTVTTEGVAPFTYLWSTGETTASITPLISGEYCISVVDANGCESSSCVYYNACFVEIEESFVDGAFVLSANTVADSPSFLWSNGETTAAISISEEGTYCVTATLTDGNVCSDCYTINFDNDISGFVIANELDTITQSPSIVYLIQYDETAGTLTAIDEQMLTNGSFAFYDVPFGQYLLKAALTPESNVYDSNMPTYYDGVLFWDEATTINIPDNINNYVINMVEGVNPGGPGFIGGLVSEGANFVGGVGSDSRDAEGDPIPNVSILLLDMNDNPVTHTVTDLEGKYSFPNLAWGTYEVIIEIPGLEQAAHIISIGENNPSSNDNHFVVNTYNITTSTTTAIPEIIETSSFAVYPNPIHDQLYVEMEMKEESEILIQIQSVNGKTLFSEQKNLSEGLQRLSFDVNDLPRGLYFLTVKKGNDQLLTRFVK